MTIDSPQPVIVDAAQDDEEPEEEYILWETDEEISEVDDGVEADVFVGDEYNPAIGWISDEEDIIDHGVIEDHIEDEHGWIPDDDGVVVIGHDQDHQPLPWVPEFDLPDGHLQHLPWIPPGLQWQPPGWDLAPFPADEGIDDELLDGMIEDMDEVIDDLEDDSDPESEVIDPPGPSD